MVETLHIVDGIIQDKDIDGIPVKLAIVKPGGARNVRTLVKMKEVIGITNHNTGNSSPTAGDEAHARYLQNLENADVEYKSVHLFVDYDSITQCVPLDEVCYHAGDGNGDGNRKTIAIEICENTQIINAEYNAKKLNAALMLTYPNLKIYKHQDWSGKFCPRVILSRKNGWNDFVAAINKIVKERGENNMENKEAPQWKVDSEKWLFDNKIITGRHDPLEDVDIGTLGAILKNFTAEKVI